MYIYVNTHKEEKGGEEKIGGDEMPTMLGWASRTLRPDWLFKAWGSFH